MPTLGRVSNPEGDAASRLSHALDEILKGAPKSPQRVPEEVGEHTETHRSEDVSRGGDDPAADHGGAEDASLGEGDQDDETYELPEIVPATLDVPVLPAPTRAVPPPAPTLPAVPAAAPEPPAPTPAPAAAVAAARTAPTTGWGDHMPVPSHSGSQLRAPGRRPRVRRVTRVVRHIDPWSTFKLALVFSMVGYLVVLTSGVLLWRVADSTGTLDNVERWFTQFGWETFELKGGEIFHNAWVIGLFAAVGMTGAAVLMATLFNLVSDIVGGIRVTVLEEEVVERTASSARRYVVRRPPLAGAGSVAPEWSVDDPAPTDQPGAVVSTWSLDDEPVEASSPEADR